MIDLANDFGLEQFVTEPTRQDSILELFFTNCPTLVEKSSMLPGLSDHDGIPVILVNTSPKVVKQKPHKVYLYKKANLPALKADLISFENDFCKDGELTVDEMWNSFKNCLKTSMDKHIPSKLVCKQNKTPWIDEKVKRSHRKKQRAYNKARKTGRVEDWSNFRKLRKSTHRLTRFSHRRYIRNFCLESRKQFWSFVKKLKKDSSGISTLRSEGLLVSENQQKAEILNKQFCSVFTHEDLEHVPTVPPKNVPNMNNIIIHEQGIEKLLQGLNPNKACGIDEISPRILKLASHEIAPILTKIFQASLDTGILPDDWRKANISPIFKKGDRARAENYRPVSLTCVCCKILEHVLHSQVMKHLDEYNVLTKFQHGFRRGHSCESQLIQTMHDLCSSRDKRLQIDMLVLDFSKAFDTVPHHRLMLKLRNYGISGSTHKWISSFLQDRLQRVVVGGEHSEWSRVVSGVPQGTVLGPLLFLLYINDLPENLSSTCRLFADDCVVYKTIISPENALTLQNDLDRLSEWEDKWHMKFNAKKCFLLRFTGSRSPIENRYNLGGSELEELSSHSYLGVEISHDLKWNTHIAKITSSANKTLGFIKRNLSSCTKDTKAAAYTALVRPTIEYCSSVWDPATKELVHEVGKIQRRAARFVCNDYQQKTSASGLIRSLNWDMLSTRRKIARVCVLHKAIGGHLAIPVSDCLRPATRSTRLSNPNSFIPISTRTDCYKYSFFPRTALDWNSLPSSIQEIKDSNNFKTQAHLHFQQEDLRNKVKD